MKTMTLALSSMILVAITMAPTDAGAITVPDSGTCTTYTGDGTCLSITHTYNNPSATAVAGASNYGRGVLGYTSTGIGVWGDAHNSGVGVRGDSSSSNGVLGINGDTTGAAAAISASPGSSSGLAYWGGGNITLTGSTATKGTAGSWVGPSDSRIKKNVTDFNQGLQALLRVRPVKYQYNGLGGTTDDGRTFVGVIAQELEKIAPTMVSSRKAKLKATDAEQTDIKQVDPSDFTYLLINAVKEQQGLIQQQEVRLAALERRLAPISSSGIPVGGIGMGLALGFVPFGLVLAGRRRRRS